MRARRRFADDSVNGELEPERTGGVIHASEEGRCRARIATMLLDEVTTPEKRERERDSLSAWHTRFCLQTEREERNWRERDGPGWERTVKIGNGRVIYCSQASNNWR